MFHFCGKSTFTVKSLAHGYACMLASLHYFDKKFTAHFQHLSFQSVNSNTRVGCEIKKTLARRKSTVTLVRFEQTLHLV